MPATISTPTSTIGFGERRHRCGERGAIAEQQRDVLEDDAGPGEIRHIADQRAQPFHHVPLLNRHRSQSIRQTLWPCPPQRALRHEGGHGRAARSRELPRCAGSEATSAACSPGSASSQTRPRSSLLLSAHREPPAEVTISVRPAPRRIPVIHPTLQPIADTLLVATALRGSNADLYHAIEFGQPLRIATPGCGHGPRPDPVRDAARLPVGPQGARARPAPAPSCRRCDRGVRSRPGVMCSASRRRIRSGSRVIPEGISPVFQPAHAERDRAPS